MNGEQPNTGVCIGCGRTLPLTNGQIQQHWYVPPIMCAGSFRPPKAAR